MLVVSFAAAACSSSEEGTAGEPVLTTPSTSTSTAPPRDAEPGEPPIEALEELWDSTLAMFASAPDERTERLAELGDRVPADVEEQAPVYFPVSLTIESNAKFKPINGEEVAITDCAFTSQPTLLGSATAGFEATGRWDAGAERWQLTNLDYVKQCVPVELAEPALAAAEQSGDDLAVAWPALDDEHPVLTNGVTEQYRAEVLENIETYREEGWVPMVDIERQSFEVAGLVRQDGVITVLVSRCTHYGEGQGTFEVGDDGEVTRVDGRPPPEAIRAVLRMILSEDGSWRFDGFGEVERVDCLEAPTDNAARTL